MLRIYEGRFAWPAAVLTIALFSALLWFLVAHAALTLMR